jgi:hypothetical protein
MAWRRRHEELMDMSDGLFHAYHEQLIQALDRAQRSGDQERCFLICRELSVWNTCYAMRGVQQELDFTA